MRKKTLHRNLVVWMLLIAFTAVHVVKTFHSHETGCESCATSENEEHHSPADCLICHFTFSPFEEYIPADLVVTRVLLSTGQIVNQERTYFPAIISYLLRAPPVVSSLC